MKKTVLILLILSGTATAEFKIFLAHSGFAITAEEFIFDLERFSTLLGH